MDSQRSVDWRTRMLRCWHLAILRFAVTRDNADRLGVLAIAGKIDGLGRGHGDKPDFGFFRKVSAELCAAILQQGETSGLTLRQFLAQIDDIRLKRAFAAALDVKPREAATSRKGSTRPNLWQGLPSRGDVQH